MAERIILINPGDLSLPEGWTKIIKRKVFVLGHKAELIDPNKFDEVKALSGSDHNEEEEKKALDETSF